MRSLLLILVFSMSQAPKAAARKATLITPDSLETRILKVEREGPLVSLLVPQVQVYSAVMIE